MLLMKSLRLNECPQLKIAFRPLRSASNAVDVYWTISLRFISQLEYLIGLVWVRTQFTIMHARECVSVYLQF